MRIGLQSVWMTDRIFLHVGDEKDVHPGITTAERVAQLDLVDGVLVVRRTDGKMRTYPPHMYGEGVVIE